jgi:hypothetical protein
MDMRRGGNVLAVIALITLIRSSNEDTAAAELIEEIQTAIQSSKISKGWSVEKISILGESGVIPAEPLNDPPKRILS